MSKSYVSGKKNLYAEEKNFDKLAKILNEQLGIDQNEAVQTLEKGLKEERWQVEFGSQGSKMTLEKKTAIEEAMKKEKESLAFILQIILLECILMEFSLLTLSAML